MNDCISVIIVEDDQALRANLTDYLNLTGFNATGVGSGLEFYHALSVIEFDVAVIDIGLPDQSGFVLVEYARKNTAMGLIIITALDTIAARVTGYDCGSDLFLAKPIDCRELAAAITSIASRNKKNQKQFKIVDYWLLQRIEQALVTPDGTQLDLTAKEYSVIELLAKSPGDIVMRELLLEKIYHDVTECNSRALDSLVRRLRRKIEVRCGVVPPIKSAYGSGYLFNAKLKTV